MQRLVETLRESTEAEQEVVTHVTELALAWQEERIDLLSVGRQCTGYERWQAMRFAPLGSVGKLALMALVDALVAADERVVDTDHGLMGRDELYSGYVKRTTDWQGVQVYVWPMHAIDGQLFYPLSHLEPGEKRREREAAMRAEYERYRKKQRGEF